MSINWFKKKPNKSINTETQNYNPAKLDIWDEIISTEPRFFKMKIEID